MGFRNKQERLEKDDRFVPQHIFDKCILSCHLIELKRKAFPSVNNFFFFDRNSTCHFSPEIFKNTQGFYGFLQKCNQSVRGRSQTKFTRRGG